MIWPSRFTVSWNRCKVITLEWSQRWNHNSFNWERDPHSQFPSSRIEMHTCWKGTLEHVFSSDAMIVIRICFTTGNEEIPNWSFDHLIWKIDIFGWPMAVCFPWPIRVPLRAEPSSTFSKNHWFRQGGALRKINQNQQKSLISARGRH